MNIGLVTVGDSAARNLDERYPVFIALLLTVTESNGQSSTREVSTTLAMVLANHDMFAALADGYRDVDCLALELAHVVPYLDVDADGQIKDAA